MPPLRIALAGLGTVGAAVLQQLRENAEIMAVRAGRRIEIVAVSARSKTKERGFSLEGLRWEDDPLAFASASDIDVVVELMGGAEGSARALCEAALRAGKSVVTANKALLAAHGTALAKMAESKKAALKYEAAVGGGIPIIKAMLDSFAGNKIAAVQGILNGTCNYILTRMEAEALPFEQVLAAAQTLGFAEADPAADLDGHDTAQKLALLATLAFGVPPDLPGLSVEGIRRVTLLDIQLATELGYRIKLLGVAGIRESGLTRLVAPMLVPLRAPLAKVDGVLNAVLIQGSPMGAATFVGSGAGGDPTSSAVLSDLMDLARSSCGLPFGVPADALAPLPIVRPEAETSRWYMRLRVADRPGVVADISAILRDAYISIESMLQHGRSRTDSVPVILTTHEVDERALRHAAAQIAKLDSVAEQPFCLRISQS
jgi:homoserine dehydrogenase